MQPIGPAQYEGSQGSETSSDFTSSSFHADGNRSFLCSLLCVRSATSFFFKVAPKFTSLFLGRTRHLSLSSHHQTGLVSPFLRFTCNSIIKISISPNKVPKLHEHFPLSHHFLSPPSPNSPGRGPGSLSLVHPHSPGPGSPLQRTLFLRNF